MKLTILGSGTLFPTKERFPSSFLLEEGNVKILLDCGHEAIARLVELGFDVRDIDAIFISHFHADHIGDAFNLVWSRFVGDLYEGKERHKPLIFFGPKTLRERFYKWREIFWLEPGEEYPLEFHEGEFEYALGNINLRTFPVKHVPWFESVGCRINVGGKIIVYPGDIGSSHDFDDLVSRVQDADLLLIEAAAERPSPNHFTLEQAAELSKKANVKKTVIVHIKPIAQWQERAREFIKDKPNFRLAEDKMVIEL